MARTNDDVTQLGEHRTEWPIEAAGIMSGNEIRDAFGLPALEPVEQETPLLSALPLRACPTTEMSPSISSSPLLSARYVDVTWRQIVLLVAVCAAVGWMIGWFVVPR